MPLDSKAFARGLVQEAHHWAGYYVKQTYGRIKIPMPRQQQVYWMRSMMWCEYKLNDIIIKEMTRLPDESHDLKYLLSQQVLDGYRHSSVFSRRLKEMGEDGDVTTYEPRKEEWKLYNDSIKWEHSAELAAALNCSGEVLLSVYLKFLVNPRKPLVEEQTAEMIDSHIPDNELSGGPFSLVDQKTADYLSAEVIPDEGRHIRNGLLVIQRYATTDDMQKRCRRAFETKIQSLTANYRHLVDPTMQRHGPSSAV